MHLMNTFSLKVNFMISSLQKIYKIKRKYKPPENICLQDYKYSNWIMLRLIFQPALLATKFSIRILWFG